MTTFASLSELYHAVGTDMGKSRQIHITQQMIDAFADVTADRQWIHTDPIRAASSTYGSTIAHGFLTLSLLAPFIEDLLEVDGIQSSINYGLNRVRFPAPVLVDSTLYCTGELTSVDAAHGATQAILTLTVHSDTSTKVACVAEVVVRLIQ
ncbi:MULTISPECIES: MaoC family dehydratase [Rhodococcus]|uniref:MaoC family dehydratase n=1 Tax=Rhodococcus globerulus TaxID=33008 RepID=UPI001C5598CD|nr:MaoC family dehydratase [Rhodococcus globerulus]QXW00473.1 MaoC family dehydratase [Rhodococcus globerulus]